MKTLILEVKENEERGGQGFSLNVPGLYNYTPGRGLLIAHDIIEHHNFNIGGVGNELMAMGGIWYVRGQFGDISRNLLSTVSAEDNIAYDVGPDLFNKWKYHDFGLPTPNVKTCSAIEKFKMIFQKGREQCIRESIVIDEHDSDFWKDYYPDAIKFMIHGWQLARKRFQSIGGASHANTIFWEIQRVVDGLPDPDYLPLGQQYALKVNMSSMRVTIEEHYERDYY